MLNKNKRLENLAWSRMEAVLDKEMPTKKKKKRFILWYWFSTAAVVLGFIAFTTFKSDQSNKTIVSIDKNASQASSSNITPEDHANDSTAVISSSQSGKRNYIVSNPENRRSHRTENAKAPKNNQNKISLSNQISNETPEIDNVFLTSYTDPVIETAINDSSINAEKSEIIEDNTDQYKKRSEVIHPLRTNNTTFLNYDQRRELIPSTFTRPAINNKPPYQRFDVNVGLGARKVASYYTPLVGVGFSYSPLRKWKISTGVYYTELTSSKDSIVLSDRFYNSYADELNKAINSTEIKNQNSTLINVYFTNQKIIHLPLTIGYQVGRQCWINAGLYYDRLLSQESIFRYTGSNAVSTTEFQVLENVKKDFLTHQVNWMVGVSYSIKPQWSIQLSMLNNHKFNNINANASASPYFQAMLNYRLLHQ